MLEIPASEIIAIIKFKQEEMRRVNISSHEVTMAIHQVNLLNLYIDKVIASVTEKVNAFQNQTTRERIVIPTQMTAHVAPEAISVTVDKIHTPTSEEVILNVIEEKVPDNIGNFEDDVRQSIIDLCVDVHPSGIKKNTAEKQRDRLAALKMVHRFYGDRCRNAQDTKMILNEMLGIDPLKDFKKELMDYHAIGGYPRAYAWAKQHLPSLVELTTDTKQNEAIIHRFVWNAINEASPARQEELAKRAAKKATA
jgi:hypothetical protein